MPTDIDNVLKKIGEIDNNIADKVAAGLKPLGEELDRMTKALGDAQTELTVIKKDRLARMDNDGRVMVRTGRLAGFDLLDVKLLETILSKRPGKYSARLHQEIADQKKAMATWLTTDRVFEWRERAIKRMTYNVFGIQSEKSMEQARHIADAMTRGLLDLVGKAMDSTTAGAGDELVPTFESSELWLDVNLATIILPLLRQTAMPTQPYDLPIQLGDTNWYPQAENIQATTTDLATQKVTLNAKGLKTGVPFSDELDEDAIVGFIPELRASLARNAAQVIDDVLLNADTTVTNGINSDGATISSASAGKAHWLLGFDGIIHQAIVDASASVSVNHNAAISVAAFNAPAGRLGKYGVGSQRGDVVYVSDPRTYISARSLTAVLTNDVAGARATMSTGELSQVFGSPYVVSQQMRIADTDGKVTDSGGNTVGRVLVTNTTQWRVGFRRQITMEMDRDAGKGQDVMYVSMRVALTERSGTRSSATHTAISYNVTGV